MPTILNPMTPTERDTRFASAGSRTLARLLSQTEEIRFRTGTSDTDEITLPAGVARLLQNVLDACVLYPARLHRARLVNPPKTVAHYLSTLRQNSLTRVADLLEQNRDDL